MVSTRPTERPRVTEDESGLLLDPRGAARELVLVDDFSEMGRQLDDLGGGVAPRRCWPDALVRW